MTMVRGNATTLKLANRQFIMKLLLEESPLTKLEMAQKTSLSFSAVSNLISEMERDNLVLEIGLAESGGGRRATLYKLNPMAHIFVGLDIQVERICLVILAADGSILTSCEQPLDVGIGPERVVEQSVNLIQEQLSSIGLSSEAVSRIGVSIPGPIDSANQMVLSPPNLPGWRNVPLKDMFESAMGIPCILEKDANAAAFGECKYGAGRGIDNLLYVMADTGIGGAIIVNGDIYRGAFNDAGDIGHMPIDIRGPRCNCGGVGCLEALASGLAIQREVYNLTQKHLQTEDIVTQSQTDKQIEQVVLMAAEYLGYAVGGLSNALNTSMVILGGSLLEQSDLYHQKTIESMKKQILPDFAYRVRIERPKFYRLSGAVGAALLAVHRDFLTNEVGSAN